MKIKKLINFFVYLIKLMLFESVVLSAKIIFLFLFVLLQSLKEI
jgi:hypothetical protein